MEISYVHTLSAQDYLNLRKAVGWVLFPERQAQTGLDHSAYLVAAVCEEKTVAAARLISDGGYVAYIADVMVLPDYQRNGIGKTMIRMILTHIRQTMEVGDAVMVCLLAAKGKEPFYRRFDFETHPNDMHGAGMSLWLEK